MGKFDGMLLCSDLDETLFTTEKTISEDNVKAIKMFMAEGGKFAFATGRIPTGARLALKYIMPNAPIICFNGAGIYDCESEKLVWEGWLDDEAARVVDFVEENMPQVGVEVCTNDKVYFCRTNQFVSRHQIIENLPDNFAPHTQIAEKWKKVIFMCESYEIPTLKKLIAESEFAERYSFIQSCANYYELLPKGMNKGSAMLRLAEMIGINPKCTIGIGDNENDIAMVVSAGIGVAVANAAPEVKNAADYITVDNNHSAIKVVIESIQNGIMKF